MRRRLQSEFKALRAHTRIMRYKSTEIHIQIQNTKRFRRDWQAAVDKC
jgi:hypothetical protein